MSIALLPYSVFPEIDDDSFDLASAPDPGVWSVTLSLPGSVTLLLDEPYWNGNETFPFWYLTGEATDPSSEFNALQNLRDSVGGVNGPDIQGQLLENGVPILDLELEWSTG